MMLVAAPVSVDRATSRTCHPAAPVSRRAGQASTSRGRAPAAPCRKARGKGAWARGSRADRPLRAERGRGEGIPTGWYECEV